MKTSLKIEELFMFFLGVYLFSALNYSWWWFVGLFLLPDLGMLGYVVNSKVGAITYNMCHHKGIAIFMLLLGYYLNKELLQLAGIILFSHASFDRVFGYGLKYYSHFKQTHLGAIGKV
ncbi:DUF4260 domain-containing protein [Tamlana fucoidanivorans]|uniref:DUF4260 family protein n=1 Tax=Allotamlana fucoidanivorans TaxID=2583814 RepID=A0A5C4SMD8_9FLAO|nr:DUF4260 domain-containing protein [Tamlana fucoidanivorans]TNJ45246.1 DUF4260 family protein [Tamlana fucoidanivorans]